MVRQIEDCKGVSNLRFIIVYVLENVYHVSFEDIEDSLLQKEQLWIGTYVKQDKGLNGTHDWKRTKRFQKEKLTDQMKVFNPSFWIAYRNQFLMYSTNRLTGFFIVGTMGLKNVTNIKSTN